MHCWWERKLVQPLWETIWKFLKKLKIELPYDAVIPLPDICSKKTKILIPKDICTSMFCCSILLQARYESNLSVHQ